MRYSRMLVKQPKRKKRYGSLIVVVVILGIAAYFIGAGAAGGWLAENIIDPVFNNGNAAAASATGVESAPDVSTEQTAEAVSLPETTGTRVEEDITAQEISLYTLQAGAFSEEANATTTANEIAAKGGAGYVAHDGDLYRVLIAGYTDEASAKDVKSSLETQGITASVFNLKSGTLKFKIGAEQSQMDAVKACFEIVPEAITSMQQIIFDADSGKNVDDAVKTLQQKVSGVNDAFKAAVSAQEGAMLSLGNYMTSLCDLLNGIPAAADTTTVAFSSKLRYDMICIAVDYSTLLDDLQS